MKLNRRTTKLHRFADRYAGIPLIFLPSLYRVRREKPNIINRICVVKTSGIGDTVLVSPVVRDLLDHYPDAHITFVAGDKNFEAARFLHSSYQDRMSFEFVDFKDFSTISALRDLHEFDLLIDFGQWPRFDAFVSMIIKCKYRIGFKRARQYRHYSYDMSVEHRSDRHELNNFRLLPKVSESLVCIVRLWIILPITGQAVLKNRYVFIYVHQVRLRNTVCGLQKNGQSYVCL